MISGAQGISGDAKTTIIDSKTITMTGNYPFDESRDEATYACAISDDRRFLECNVEETGMYWGARLDEGSAFVKLAGGKLGLYALISMPDGTNTLRRLIFYPGTCVELYQLDRTYEMDVQDIYVDGSELFALSREGPLYDSPMTGANMLADFMSTCPGPSWVRHM